MRAGRLAAHNGSMRSAARRSAGRGVRGVTAAAEIGTVALWWGLQPLYKSMLFGLYNLTIAVIGALAAVRHPRSPIGWILAGFSTLTAVLSDFGAAYGHRASPEGWPAGPLAEWIGFGSWSPAALMGCWPCCSSRRAGCPGRGGGWWPGRAAPATCCTSRPGCSTRPTAPGIVSGTNPYAVAGPPYGVLAAAGGGLLTLAPVGSLGSPCRALSRGRPGGAAAAQVGRPGRARHRGPGSGVLRVLGRLAVRPGADPGNPDHRRAVPGCFGPAVPALRC